MPKPENIIPHKWKKGQSGNPKGRPTIRPLMELLEEQVGTQGARDILAALQKKAKGGDVRAAEVLLERLYGKVAQNIDLKGELAAQVSITVDSSETEKELKELLNGGAADERLGT